MNSLSPNHPLRTDPNRPWPYVVLVGYRAAGSRKIIDHSRQHVRATSHQQAMHAGIIAARESGYTRRTKDGKRLIASRALSARPLDLQDRIGADLTVTPAQERAA